MHGKGRTRVGDDVLDAALMHGYHIGITLHHIDAILLRDGLLRLEETIEFAFLMIDLRIRRVHVFLLHALRPGVQQSSSEGHHLSADVQPRKDHTTSIPVEKNTRRQGVHGVQDITRVRRTIVLYSLSPCLLVSFFNTQSRLHQILRLVSRFLGGCGQGITLR